MDSEVVHGLGGGYDRFMEPVHGIILTVLIAIALVTLLHNDRYKASVAEDKEWLEEQRLARQARRKDHYYQWAPTSRWDPRPSSSGIRRWPKRRAGGAILNKRSAE